MITSALDVSKNWSGAATRFAYGSAFILTILSFSDNSGNNFKVLDIIRDDITALSLLFIALTIIGSLLVGNLLVELGSTGFGEHFTPKKHAERALKIGDLDNALLARMLSEANVKFEIAAGFYGYLTAALVGAILYMTLTYLGLSTSEKEQVKIDWNFPIIAMVFGLLVSFLLRWSATRTLLAVDHAIELHEHRTNDAG